jgi:serine/threonine protein kinase
MRTKTRKQRGGAYVGHGTYGCGFRPALRCEGEVTRRRGKFSKLVSRETARDEIKYRNLLMPYDPHQQYFLYPETICKPAVYAPKDNIHNCPHDFSKRRKARVIILSKGGRAISRFQPSEGDYLAFFTSFANLFDGLLRIHHDGIAHNDIKPDNVVTRKKADGSYSTRFIDFGLMINGAELAARALDQEDPMSNYDVLHSNYIFWSFDMRLTDPMLLAEARTGSVKTETEIDNYYDNVTKPNRAIPYSAFEATRMTLADVVDLADRLTHIPLIDRHKFIVTSSDVLGLGLTLAETYFRLTGHCDVGFAVPIVHILDNLNTAHPFFVAVDTATRSYNAADRAWHIAVRNHISIPLYMLVRRMIHVNPFIRIDLHVARAAYQMLLPRMAHLFTEANITEHLKQAALSKHYAPVNFVNAAIAAGAVASSSPVAVAADAAVAEDVMGFAQSPLLSASPEKIPRELAVSSSSPSSNLHWRRRLNTLSLSSDTPRTMREVGFSPRRTRKNS